MTRRPEDKEIYTAANTLVKRWGEDAPLEAARNADAMIERGNPDGLAFWKRVIKAIEVLQAEEMPPGHATVILALDIVLPALTAAHEIQPKPEGLSISDVQEAFIRMMALSSAGPGHVSVARPLPLLAGSKLFRALRVPRCFAFSFEAALHGRVAGT